MQWYQNPSMQLGNLALTCQAGLWDRLCVGINAADTALQQGSCRNQVAQCHSASKSHCTCAISMQHANRHSGGCSRCCAYSHGGKSCCESCSAKELVYRGHGSPAANSQLGKQVHVQSNQILQHTYSTRCTTCKCSAMSADRHN